MKNRLIAVLKQLLKVFFLFPIRENRIFFSAYSGKNYSCNPKYIAQELLKDPQMPYEMIWAFTEPQRYTDLDPRIRRVRFKSLPYLYYLLTSRVVVDNVESWSILPKRRGQLIINTWHGGGAYKGVGLKRLDTDAQLDRNMLNKHKRVDLYLSSSKCFTKMTLRDSFGYQGEVLECGMPRNDLLVKGGAEKAAQVREKLSLDPSWKLALYAPTFRADTDYRFELDAKGTLEALTRRFGGTWKLLYRAHYYLGKENYRAEDVIDVTAYDDMQELLLISDVLITDYSSSIWDFSLTEKPAFLFTPDLDAYAGERDFYTPIDTWPYPYSKDREGFVRLIEEYEEESAREKIRAHHRKLENCESGAAAARTAERIRQAAGRRPAGKR